MDDRGRVGLAIGLGAVIGGAVGYLLFTDRGRELRASLEPRLQDLMTEIDQLTHTFDRARAAAVEGWQSVSTLVQQEADQAADQAADKATDAAKRAGAAAGETLKDVQSGRTH